MKASEIISFLKSEGNLVYKNQKDIMPLLTNHFNKSSKEILIELNKLKTAKVIQRHFVSGKCETVCASCYEYGCDKPNTPPLSFWKINIVQ